MRRVVFGMAAVVTVVSLCVGLSLAADAKKKADATLKLSEGSVAVGIGWSWGKGTLTYKGKKYPVKVEGLSVGEVGVTRATAVGNVRNLKQLADFDGTYVAGGAEGTVGGGAGISTMKNQNGVVVELKSTTQGANLKLAAEGLKLSVVKSSPRAVDSDAAAAERPPPRRVANQNTWGARYSPNTSRSTPK